MTCLHYIPLLDDYVDGELRTQKVTEVDLHLESCASCRLELKSIRRLKELLHQQKSPTPDSQYWVENLEGIKSRTIESEEWLYPSESFSDRKKVQSDFIRAFVSAAAALGFLVISIFIGTSQNIHFTDYNPKESPVFVMNPLENESDSQNTIILTKAEQINQIKGKMLISPPGMLGRISAMYEYNQLEN